LTKEEIFAMILPSAYFLSIILWQLFRKDCILSLDLLLLLPHLLRLSIQGSEELIVKSRVLMLLLIQLSRLLSQTLWYSLGSSESAMVSGVDSRSWQQVGMRKRSKKDELSSSKWWSVSSWYSLRILSSSLYLLLSSSLSLSIFQNPSIFGGIFLVFSSLFSILKAI
jgi:hypothetical protein